MTFNTNYSIIVTLLIKRYRIFKTLIKHFVYTCCTHFSRKQCLCCSCCIISNTSFFCKTQYVYIRNTCSPRYFDFFTFPFWYKNLNIRLRVQPVSLNMPRRHTFLNSYLGYNDPPHESFRVQNNLPFD